MFGVGWEEFGGFSWFTVSVCSVFLYHSGSLTSSCYQSSIVKIILCSKQPWNHNITHILGVIGYVLLQILVRVVYVFRGVALLNNLKHSWLGQWGWVGCAPCISHFLASEHGHILLRMKEGNSAEGISTSGNVQVSACMTVKAYYMVRPTVTIGGFYKVSCCEGFRSAT